ncbi:2,3-diaminopropionate biosynthesis protein SbnA [Bradyrhizobium sp.]
MKNPLPDAMQGRQADELMTEIQTSVIARSDRVHDGSPSPPKISCSLVDMIPDDLVFTVNGLLEVPIFVKCEGLNAAGSIKIKAARRIVDDLESSGELRAGDILIESSSGNLGIALSMIAAQRGYKFICVTDPNATQSTVALMRALGAEVIVVTERDENNGYLGTRIDLIKSMCVSDTSKVWVNQYGNESNWLAHFETTGPEIAARFPKVDWLFVGAGTTGTLMGCARYFKKFSPNTHVVAVDAEGSVTFGGKPAQRHIAGLGTSRRPAILDERYVDRVIDVTERATVQMCRQLARAGALVGGSTGSVLAGIVQSKSLIRTSDVVVTISPDLGMKYLDTIFDDGWLASKQLA